jgi:type 1 glutamine amidotransferase
MRRFCTLLVFACLTAGYPADRILIFSETLGFRHAEGIDAGIAALRAMGGRLGFEADLSEKGADFTDANLARYQAVVFLSPSGEVFDATQKAAFRKFISDGKGFVGIHNATAYVLEGWGWYDSLVCARYESEIQATSFRLEVVDKNHPSTSTLPQHWTLQDADAYNFTPNPKALGATVLLNLDETGLEEGTMGSDHPFSWYHAYAGGRAWYTVGGSSAEAFSDSLFLLHLAGGIRYALGTGGSALRQGTRPTARAGAESPEASPIFLRPGGDGARYDARGRSERDRTEQVQPR